MKYNKQRNLCVSITRKAKRSYYENLNLKGITNSKKFWATVKPLFSNNIKSTEYITLEENGKIISNDKELAKIFNEFFVNIVPNLGINTNHSFLINTDNENDPIEKAIAKYKSHPSIISIKKFMENSDSSFSFQHVSKYKITKAIKMLDPKKVVQSNDIPTKLIKSFSGLFFQMFQKFTKGVCMIRSMIFLKINFLNTNADFVRVSIPKMHFFPW